MADEQTQTTPITAQQTMGIDPRVAIEYLRQQIAQQANTTGLTTQQPSFAGARPPAQRQYPAQQQLSNQTFGVGEGGARKRESMQNFGKSMQNLASQIGQYRQAQKQRDYEVVIGKASQAQMGAQDAQARLQQAQAAIRQAMQSGDRQALQQAIQQQQQANRDLQQNNMVLDSIRNNPKESKILTDAFNVGGKQKPMTPQQQAAQKVVMQNILDQSRQSMTTQTGGITIPAQQTPMGNVPAQQALGQTQTVQGPPTLSPATAQTLSQLPTTTQLSPAARQQQMAVQAGVVAKPAQTLSMAEKSAELDVHHVDKTVDQTLKAEQITNAAGLATDKLVSTLPSKGLKALKNSDGTYQRDANGQLVLRNMTLSDLKNNPELAQKWDENQAKINLQVAEAKATKVRSAVAEGNLAIRREQMSLLAAPGAIQNWAAAVSDPSTGVTLAQVPAMARGAVLNAVASSGRRLTKPLTSDEIKRSDLAGNAVDNLKAAQSILARRPDMFGPAGWGKTRFEMALAGGDKDAIDYLADVKLANLPLVGIHGVRGKYAIEDFEKLDSNLYLNADSMNFALTDAIRSSSNFMGMGGRVAISPQTVSGKSTKSLADRLSEALGK
jgi:hypothetical protein